MGRLSGRTVILYDKRQTGVDGFNRPIYEDVPITVDNVLIGIPSAQEVIDALNLTGKRAAYTLGIPKGDTHTWTDRKVEFFGPARLGAECHGGALWVIFRSLY